MTTAKIEPAGPRDLAMHRDQYDRLVIELQELGFDAEIELWERRGAIETASHIIIHLGEFGAPKASRISYPLYAEPSVGCDVLRQASRARL
jgi:hypothetical protein